MFYDAKVDIPECGLDKDKADKRVAICTHCAPRELSHGLPGDASPEDRKAWEEHHLNLPRLYIPLRATGDGAPLGKLLIRLHTTFTVNGRLMSQCV